MPLVIPGLRVEKNEHNRFCSVFLHYSADPEKDPSTESGKAWVEMFKALYSGDEIRWKREMELSFETAAGKPVYMNFDRQTHVWQKPDTMLGWPAGRPVYRGWDFGFHRPACVWGFENEKDQLVMLYELLGHDVQIHEFADEVIARSKEWFPGASFHDFCDPAGAQRSDKSEKSSVEVLGARGIGVSFRKSGIREGLNVVRLLLSKRSDGTPGLLVHPRCRILIEGLGGAYHYPEIDPKAPSVESEVPEKDGFFEHIQDAFRYMAIGIRTPSGVVKVKRPISVKDRVDPRKQDGLKQAERGIRTGY